MNFIYLFDLIGTFAFAASGALLGIKKNMDMYGLFVLAAAVGVGGGTVRDMMLGSTPPFVLVDPNYIIVILFAIVICIIFNKFVLSAISYLNLLDAIGLGVFTVIGVSKGLDAHLPWYSCILLGILTSTGGGMIRDVLAGDVPFVLKREIYASASILGGVIFLLMVHANLPRSLAALLCSVAVVMVRMYTLKYNFNLPIFTGSNFINNRDINKRDTNKRNMNSRDKDI